MPSLPDPSKHCLDSFPLGRLALHGEDDTSEGVGQTPEQQQQRASASSATDPSVSRRLSLSQSLSVAPSLHSRFS